ncbi:MAG: 30S ribosomal protein S5, partial [Pontimonas sp.]|nr:30S ribosomal protein S5 [Pontimonas sp.]
MVEETPVAAPEAEAAPEREARRGSRERNPNARERGARDNDKSQFLERVVTINRVSKV